MKQISTGAGLLGLGVCMVATAFIATHRGGNEAFAQTSVVGNRVVGVGNLNAKYLYRVFEDGAVDTMQITTPVDLKGEYQDVWKRRTK